MSQLSVQVEDLSPVVRRLQIEVPADRVVQVTDDVYKKLGRTVKLKGYRQGHVPRRVLEKHFADQVKTDVAREIVDQTFPEALGTTSLSPVASPTVEPQEVKLGESFSYSARIEVRPEVKLEQYKGLAVSVAESVVSETEIGKQLEQLREAMATLVAVEGRDDVQFGDVASISYEMTFLGTSRAPATRDDALVRVEHGLFIDGKGEKLVGAKVGEVREFTEDFPSEDVADELKGKQAHVKVTVKGLKKREMPGLDDEFAKDVGGAESLADLKEKIRKDLETQAAESNKRDRRNALLQKLVELNPLEVPPALVDNAAERFAEDFVQNLARRGLPMDGKSPVVEQFKREVQPKALFDVKSFFLLDAVAKAEGVEVKSEDLDARMEKIAAEEGIPVARVRQAYRTAGSIGGLIGTLRNEKALEIVESHAKVTVGAAKEGGESAGA